MSRVLTHSVTLDIASYTSPNLSPCEISRLFASGMIDDRSRWVYLEHPTRMKVQEVFEVDEVLFQAYILDASRLVEVGGRFVDVPLEITTCGKSHSDLWRTESTSTLALSSTSG